MNLRDRIKAKMPSKYLHIADVCWQLPREDPRRFDDHLVNALYAVARELIEEKS